MPRSSAIVNKLIASKQQQLAEDREQLSELKREFITNPSEFVQKSINAMRTTIANGMEDLEDLKAEAADIVAFEASEAGQRRREETQRKLLVADAAVDVCVLTASEADRALSAAWGALRRHHNAHAALRDAVGAAYGAVTLDSGFDVHGDQAFLLMSYSDLSNSGTALVEWIVESLEGYNLENFIQVKGVTLHHDRHETLQAADGLMLSRMWQRLKEIAGRCGVDVHAEDHPALPSLRQALLGAIPK